MQYDSADPEDSELQFCGENSGSWGAGELGLGVVKVGTEPETTVVCSLSKGPVCDLTLRSFELLQRLLYTSLRI